MAVCYIFGAGEYSETDVGFAPSAEDFVIAADAGYSHLLEKHISPSLAVGDFDSLGYVPHLSDVVRHPVMKADTDMLLAVKEGFGRGFSDFVIYGALGGRLDHTVANLQTLVYIAENGGTGFLIGRSTTACAVKNATLNFPRGFRGTVSVFCMGLDARGVYLKGLKYPLTDAVLTCGVPLGVSNEFTREAASVTVRDGVLLVMWEGNSDAGLPDYSFNEEAR